MEYMNKVELLAPVGSFKGLLAVINAGADAVYLASDRFGARAYAENFNQETILEAIDVAHLFGVKVYLTLNTLIKEKEINDIIPFLEPMVNHGLDGVIVQDMGIVSLIFETFPKLPIHASTQMSVTGASACNILKKYNVTRVVPARELSLEEIRNIKEKSGLEIETFIHGAMCYSYSGMCLFSSILGGRSGNRGRCAQPCRLPYCVESQKKELYPLSMKDMCALPLIGELIEAGIDSFKIEGRMKKPVYAAGVTAIYRKYIDMFYHNGEIRISDSDNDILNNLYIRSEICEGYYHQHNGKDMITLKSPSYNGSSEEVIKEIEDRYVNVKPTLSIDCHVKFVVGESISLSYSKDNVFVEVKGDVVQKATNAPVLESKIREQVSKTGDTYFKVNSVEVETDNEGFVPIKAINELRRSALEKLFGILVNE